MDNTNIFIITSILLILAIVGTGFVYKKRKKGGSKDKSVIGLIVEYSGLITSLITDAVSVLSVDKTMSEDDFKDKLADIVADKFYEEVKSEDDLKDTIIARLTKDEIKNAILLFFQMESGKLKLSDIFKNKQVTESKDEGDAEEPVKDSTVDISDHI